MFAVIGRPMQTVQLWPEKLELCIDEGVMFGKRIDDDNVLGEDTFSHGGYGGFRLGFRRVHCCACCDRETHLYCAN